MKKSLTQGFTLIELLVVIAIIGILAAVVLIAINPAERIKEAQDSQYKSDLGQVATAMESCFTANQGDYTNCLSPAALKAGGYLKQTITEVTINGTGAGNPIAYVEVFAKSNGGGCGTGLHAYMEYKSVDGSTTKVACTGTVPTGT